MPGAVEDLIGNELEPGQVEEAINTDTQCPITGQIRQPPYEKWGQDYVPSLRDAHEHEHCVSFEDPGTQLYGANSPLFLWLLERLRNAFDNIEPPKPSLSIAPQKRRDIDMSRQYNTCRPTCFAGAACVLLSYPSVESSVCALRDLRPGVLVHTIGGPRRVRHVLCCLANCNIGRDIVRPRAPEASADLLVTPYHLVSLDGGRM